MIKTYCHERLINICNVPTTKCMHNAAEWINTIEFIFWFLIKLNLVLETFKEQCIKDLKDNLQTLNDRKIYKTTS